MLWRAAIRKQSMDELCLPRKQRHRPLGTNNLLPRGARTATHFVPGCCCDGSAHEAAATTRTVCAHQWVHSSAIVVHGGQERGHRNSRIAAGTCALQSKRSIVVVWCSGAAKLETKCFNDLRQHVFAAYNRESIDGGSHCAHRATRRDMRWLEFAEVKGQRQRQRRRLHLRTSFWARAFV